MTGLGYLVVFDALGLGSRLWVEGEAEGWERVKGVVWGTRGGAGKKVRGGGGAGGDVARRPFG